MIITRTSPLTGKENTMEIDVSNAQIHAWKCGDLIQVAMPTLTSDEREFIKTGYTADDWEAMFGPSHTNEEQCKCQACDEDGYTGTRL